MNKKKLTIVGVVLIIGIIAAVIISQKVKPIVINSPTPTEKPISQVVPTEVEISKGTIAAFNNSILSVKVSQGNNKSFNIANTEDIQAVVSGTIEGGDAVTVKTVKTDLVVNKEVMVFAQKGTNVAKSVYILK